LINISFSSFITFQTSWSEEKKPYFLGLGKKLKMIFIEYVSSTICKEEKEGSVENNLSKVLFINR